MMNQASEFRIIIPCVAKTSITCGGDPNEVSDVDVRRNAAGRPIVPGTSIAGVLRQAYFELADDRHDCVRYVRAVEQSEPAREVGSDVDDEKKNPCRCSTCRLFGNTQSVALRKDEQDEEVEQFASRVWVSDSVFYEETSNAVNAPRRLETRIADGVGISRERRAAADAKKYERTEVHPGGCLDIEVRVQDPTEQELGNLVQVLRKLAHGRLGLGRRTSEGLGCLQLRQLPTEGKKKSKGKRKKHAEFAPRVDYRDLNRAAHLTNVILHDTLVPRDDRGSAWADRSKLAKQNKKIVDRLHQLEKQLSRPPADDSFVIGVKLSATDDSAVLVSDPTEAFQTGFDYAPRGGPDAAELPGSSLRGCLRSTVERILRTIASDKSSWSRIACHVTDESKCGPPDDPKATCCLACQMFGNTNWASRFVVNVESIDEKPSEAAAFDHVSIDRFTGGARDQRKFNALTARERTYRAAFTFRTSASRGNVPANVDWMVALLAFALRDLHEGYANLGAASSRGLGRFQIDHVDWGPFQGRLEQCVADLQEAIKAAVNSQVPSGQEPAHD